MSGVVMDACFAYVVLKLAAWFVGFIAGWLIVDLICDAVWRDK